MSRRNMATVTVVNTIPLMGFDGSATEMSVMVDDEGRMFGIETSLVIKDRTINPYTKMKVKVVAPSK